MPQVQPSTGLFVRGVAAADAPALFRLCHDLGYEPAKEGFHERLHAITADPNHAVFVCVGGDDAVVGFVHVFGRQSVEVEPCAQIQALVVDAGGRRRGAGALLTGAAEEWAKARGLTWLSLYCAEDRDAAHGFYQSAGFELATSASRFIKQLD
ncbi:MAG: GNAT family N-acetyltransferase [Magnetovibrio sp.]|nr:GNAT family N-acetyltransferase [Magnetovibrio sp.]